ncbi:g5162 [Coccomyxa elongata]
MGSAAILKIARCQLSELFDTSGITLPGSDAGREPTVDPESSQGSQQIKAPAYDPPNPAQPIQPHPFQHASGDIVAHARQQEHVPAPDGPAPITNGEVASLQGRLGELHSECHRLQVSGHPAQHPSGDMEAHARQQEHAPGVPGA